MTKTNQGKKDRYEAYLRVIENEGMLAYKKMKEATKEEEEEQQNVSAHMDVTSPTWGPSNVVCMLSKDHFVREGDCEDGMTIFRVFRGGPCHTKDVIKWRTLDGVGTAIAGHHYHKSEGTVVFQKGQTMATFGVLVIDDRKWEPTRDFVVALEEVVEGNCVIGALDHTVCIIADDDIYPQNIPRPHDMPMKASEKTLPTCTGAEFFLTPDETPDWRLVLGYIKERWDRTWPASYWGAVWACYRAAYGVAVSLVVVVFVDQVLVVPENDTKGAAAGRLTLAFVLAIGVLFAKLVNAKTETWIIDNRKGALTRKHLREWIVVQLLWADEARLSMMRASNYLNAATSEVDAAADCYETIFPMIEAGSRFVFNFLMICYLVPIAAPVILLLIPVAVFVQWFRAPMTSDLLVKRQQCERQWVSTLADVIENTAALRGLAAAGNIAQTFSAESQKFSRAHLDALHYNTRTRQMVDAFSAVVLCGILILAAVLTNAGLATPGAIVGLITAFQSSSSNVLDISKNVLYLKFCSERLRNVCRILNYPTDAHSLADMEKGMNQVSGVWKKHRQAQYELVNAKKDPETIVPGMSEAELTSVDWNNHDEDGFPKTVGPWCNHLCVKQHTHRSSTRRSLNHCLASMGKPSNELLDKVVVMSLQHETPAEDEEGDMPCNASLGGVLLIKGARSSDLNNLLQILSGAKAAQHRDNLYTPAFLYYIYVSATPSLMEGSILHNLMCALSKRRSRIRNPTEKEAWRVAELCGLSDEYLDTPDTFSVGKGGRNLSMSDRQSICLARAILCDPDVLLLHQPTAMMDRDREIRVLRTLSEFFLKGGLWGILEGPDQGYRGRGGRGGRSPLDYVAGTGLRTVMFTHPDPSKTVKSIMTMTLTLETFDTELRSSLDMDVNLSNLLLPSDSRQRLLQMGNTVIGSMKRFTRGRERSHSSEHGRSGGSSPNSHPHLDKPHRRRSSSNNLQSLVPRDLQAGTSGRGKRDAHGGSFADIASLHRSLETASASRLGLHRNAPTSCDIDDWFNAQTLTTNGVLPKALSDGGSPTNSVRSMPQGSGLDPSGSFSSSIGEQECAASASPLPETTPQTVADFVQSRRSLEIPRSGISWI